MKTNPILLDGAMGTALRERGLTILHEDDAIWSAGAVLEAPKAVQTLHEDYIKAGCDIITISNYAMTRSILGRVGIEDRLEEMTLLAAKLANQARENTKNKTQRSVRIAGSLPPLKTSYRADLVGPFEGNVKEYDEIAGVLAPHCDVFICETLTKSDEAIAAVTAAKPFGKEILVSFTLSPDGFLRGGEDLKTALQALEGHPITGVLVNCCCLEAANLAQKTFKTFPSLKFGAYCNPVLKEPKGGEPETTISKPVSPKDYANWALDWFENGATYIGGCCDTNPEFIQEINRKITKREET